MELEHNTPLDRGQRLITKHNSSELCLEQKKIWLCVQCELDLNITLGQGHDTVLDHGLQLCEILSRSNFTVELWPRHGLWLCVKCDLDLGDMTLGQSHDTPLTHGQQLCGIVSKSNMTVVSYVPDKATVDDRQTGEHSLRGINIFTCSDLYIHKKNYFLTGPNCSLGVYWSAALNTTCYVLKTIIL